MYAEIIADQVEPLHEPVVVGVQDEKLVGYKAEDLVGFKAEDLQWPGPLGDPVGKPFVGVDLAEGADYSAQVQLQPDGSVYLPVYTTPPIISISTKKNKKVLTEKGKATLVRFGAVEK